MELKYSEIAELADSGAYGGTRELDGYTCAFVLSLLALWPSYQFAWSDSDSEWDNIDNLVGTAVDQIMTESSPVLQHQVGDIFATARVNMPEQYRLCDGSIVSKATYPELAAVIDPAYDRDPWTMWLPDLRGRVPMGMGSGPGLTPRSLGAQGGDEQHLLTLDEIPGHKHEVFHTDPTAPMQDTEWRYQYSGTQYSRTSTGVTGGGNPHNNVQPFEVLKWYICVGTQVS